MCVRSYITLPCLQRVLGYLENSGDGGEGGYPPGSFSSLKIEKMTSPFKPVLVGQLTPSPSSIKQAKGS